ncbi:uncharacterized protein MONBRDRAFT_36998 [Monosiga brevicollis MX1]|uniref:UBA domain-containing protein n=1 Tax=Monosiga brevicollis TaxID=81824 RepID=A9UYX6_MONBE|nr:uncharacterized protein MONBRDRAFT_36998 [Monosiga brevicollis MX1]EDQ89537.1 predicted protein [Monosiga brevicollis MX1]|eukprot:XP_001745566.1 hypothetical protein [Monosiga brevicollis MX1]
MVCAAARVLVAAQPSLLMITPSRREVLDVAVVVANAALPSEMRSNSAVALQLLELRLRKLADACSSSSSSSSSSNSTHKVKNNTNNKSSKTETEAGLHHGHEEEAYATQLSVLREMGFPQDKSTLLALLHRHHGVMAGVVGELFASSLSE